MLKSAVAVLYLFLAYLSSGFAAPISGAGSSAAFPVYQGWATEYARATGEQVNYEAIGSSAGVQKIRARQTDFGASDVAPTPEELTRDHLLAIPTVITGVAPFYNLPKIKGGEITLNGDVLAKIFMGEIVRWDAQEIRALNSHLILPSLPIVAVVRSDGSGTTYNFADYLAKMSPAWQAHMGVANNLKWPKTFVPAKGSQGVVDKVVSIVGAIGYVDYNYVVDHHLSYAQMKNAAGIVVAPNPVSFRAALRVSAWQSKGDFSQTLTNQPGKQSWPITMGTFILLPKTADNTEQTLRVIRFFTWAFMRGDDLANRLNFVRLPDIVQAKAFRTLVAVTDKNGTPIGIRGLQMQAYSPSLTPTKLAARSE